MQAKKHDEHGFVRRGGLWVLCQGVLLLAVFPGGVIWSHQWSSRTTDVTGWVLLFIAIVCGLAGTVSLGRNLTPFPHPSSTTKLVQTGIYRFIRHPLYTAVFCGSLGWCLVFASCPALVAALCLGPFFDAKAQVEERALRLKFAEYAEYEKRVRRFIPGLY